MLYLKEINLEDAKKEYECYRQIPKDENGFTNDYAGVTEEEFCSQVIPVLIGHSRGEGLPEGYVPDTSYFLWDDEEIVGLFRLRHHLTESLRTYGGHIGYYIRRDMRGKGYATKGLALLIEKARDIVPEKELYLSCYVDNPASLAVQQKNGAVIHHSDGTSYFTRIPFKQNRKEGGEDR